MRWDAAGTRIEDRTSGEHLATMKTTRVGRQKPAALEPGEAELHDGHRDAKVGGGDGVVAE
jgi:hypothetical protein